MAITDQLFRFSYLIMRSPPWILSLTDSVYHFGYSSTMAFINAISTWYQLNIGTIAGFLIANLILSMLSIVSFQSIRKVFQSKQPYTPDYTSIETFIESIERYPQSSSMLKRSKSKQNPSVSDLDSWTKEMQAQVENGYDEISSEIDNDGPGEMSLFTEDYITESEHNRALASLDYQIGTLIRQVSKRDYLLRKSRAETIHAETLIDELQDKVKSLKADLAKNVSIIKDLQHSNDEKEKLICKLHVQVLIKLTDDGVSKEGVDSSHSIEQEKKSSLTEQEQEQEATPNEGKSKAKDVMTYIPPNRRRLSQA